CAVAVLPFVARRFGEGDIESVRRGMRQITLAAAAYCIVLVTPALLLGGPRLARALAESARTADLATIALRFCPLACLVMVPFVLCRPAFEGLQRGRPGLTMAVLRYAVLTIPCAFLGMQAAAALSAEPLYGLLGGLVVASSASSAVFLAWLRRTLRGLEVRPG
ncbi:MAG TPA: MATE family efflux transporter, partial [Candidatus Binatia bacterium]|nr:MATE family efflux transporter [Candidatus Binatia bacterium]